MKDKKKLDKEVKELVLWRLETSVPSHFKLSVGEKGVYTKEELKKHIQAEDEVGRNFVDMQLKFIRAVASGEFSKTLAET
ncbi:MAG: hypothetical protein JW778_01930 [Candidatus Altiarchaeota archaeon]|nr:hypothetical protein [Candidatus Altiarchaeota archaeon]